MDIHPEPERTARSAYAQAEPASGAASRIVVCDSDTIAARLMARYLSEAGYTISQCATAGECQSLVARVQPALVILAILLRGTDGLALCRQLREGDRTIRLLVVSALQAEERALLAGADAFSLKPIHRVPLLETVRRLTSDQP